jgi:hypothetical protein
VGAELHEGLEGAYVESQQACPLVLYSRVRVSPAQSVTEVGSFSPL